MSKSHAARENLLRLVIIIIIIITIMKSQNVETLLLDRLLT